MPHSDHQRALNQQWKKTATCPEKLSPITLPVPGLEADLSVFLAIARSGGKGKSFRRKMLRSFVRKLAENQACSRKQPDGSATRDPIATGLQTHRNKTRGCRFCSGKCNGACKSRR